MPRADALVAALSMLEQPNTAKLARASRLPEGMAFLLEIAAGDAHALSHAIQLTGRTDATLRKAAGFFIEQVLLHPGGDSYRILGSNRRTPLGELRRNMALIMRWLHPDVAPSSSGLDRSLFASRITKAWETIKTDERRSTYNSSLAAMQHSVNRGAGAEAPFRQGEIARVIHDRRNGSTKRLTLQRVKPDGFWSRLRLLLGGGQ